MRRKAMLWERLESGNVHCRLCAHNCLIDEGGFGFCGMRQNTDGELFTYAYGRAIAAHVDPIEKKPLYHFLPGTYTFSVATMGCNFRCAFCQNWQISQLSAEKGDGEGKDMSPDQIVEEAIRTGSVSISYTYTEPTIFFEYAYDTARAAREKGLKNIFVTNGFLTEEAIDSISPYLDAANVDLKYFREEAYRDVCGGRLAPVLDAIRYMKKAGIWVEITTLLIPGSNDSDDEIREIADFVASVGEGIPWHISRFHPDHMYTDVPTTPLDTVRRVEEAGKRAGLKYVYAGNVPDPGETSCAGCGAVLIERAGFTGKMSPDLLEDGKCGRCGTPIEGVWA